MHIVHNQRPPGDEERSARESEPAIIERARRLGWGALALALVIAVMWRVVAAPGWVAGAAVASALAGLLAIINVTLVRGLYRQLGKMARRDGPRRGAD